MTKKRVEIARYNYGEICPIHNVEVDDPQYQTEDGGGYPVNVFVGCTCPLCRKKGYQLIDVTDMYTGSVSDEPIPFGVQA